MALYETLYRRKCRLPLHWDKIGKTDALKQALGQKVTQTMIKDVKLIRERMK